MKILVTGSEGYIGIPLLWELHMRGNHEVVGVDNGLRKALVEEFDPNPNNGDALPRDKGFIRLKWDMRKYDIVKEILQLHKPQCIIHLASQPSMPYSQINGERASFTQLGNLAMCLNLLWAIKELGLKTRLIITTTTGIPGQAYNIIREEPTMNMAGSWYHISRGFDSENCMLASRQWGQEVLEFRTSIVFGLTTPSMPMGYTTRFDTDAYFGTALNRFIKQACNGEPITIYGKGEQVKPFISLTDCVVSLANAIEHEVDETYNIYNQVTHNISIRELGELVAHVKHSPLLHVDNPRVEKEDWDMVFENEKFLNILGRKPTNIKDEIKNLVNMVAKNK